MSLLNTTILPFKTEAYHKGDFVTVTDETLKGHRSVVFFLPGGFHICLPNRVAGSGGALRSFPKVRRGNLCGQL